MTIRTEAPPWTTGTGLRFDDVDFGDVQAVLARTDPRRWHKVPARGVRHLRHSLQAVVDRAAGEPSAFGGTPQVAVHVHDDDLAVAWGPAPAQPKLLASMAGRTALGVVDAFWRGNHVTRQMYLSVDGGTAYIPVPRTRQVGRRGQLTEVADHDIPLVQLVHDLDDLGDFYAYLVATGWYGRPR